MKRLKDKRVQYSEKYFTNIIGSNDNPTAAELERIYRKLLVCHEIVYKRDRSNCIPNDTGVLTVSSALPNQQRIVDAAFSAKTFECNEFDYHYAINEEMEKFDEHLYSYVASSIENKIIANLRRNHKKECSQCINVFYEDELASDDYVIKKNLSDAIKIPCISTVNIIKASNKIFSILKGLENSNSAENIHDRSLKTVMSLLPIEELYTNSDFESHEQCHEQWTHKEKFIYAIVSEYMKQKSCKIGNRITEEEKGKYIRHNNKKLVHISGQ